MNASLYLRKSNFIKSFTNNFYSSKISFNYPLNLMNFIEKAKGNLIENVNTKALAINNKIENFISSKIFH